MASKQYRALEEVHLGMAPSVKAGEIVPPTYLDMQLQEHPVDFDRLLDLGAVEPANGPSAPVGDTDGATAPTDAPAAPKRAAAKQASKSQA